MAQRLISTAPVTQGGDLLPDAFAKQNAMNAELYATVAQQAQFIAQMQGEIAAFAAAGTATSPITGLSLASAGTTAFTASWTSAGGTHALRTRLLGTTPWTLLDPFTSGDTVSGLASGNPAPVYEAQVQRIVAGVPSAWAPNTPVQVTLQAAAGADVTPGAINDLTATGTSSAGLTIAGTAPVTGTTPFTYRRRHVAKGALTGQALTDALNAATITNNLPNLAHILTGLTPPATLWVVEVAAVSPSGLSGPWARAEGTTLAGSASGTIPPDTWDALTTTYARDAGVEKFPLSLLVRGTGQPAGTIEQAFVHFRDGDVQPSTSLVVKNGATALETRLMVRDLFPSGAVKDGYLSYPAPAINAEGVQYSGFTLAKQAATGSTTPLVWATVVSGRTLSVQLGSQTVNVMTLLAAASDDFANSHLIRRHIEVPVTGMGSKTSARYLAYLTVTASGECWLDHGLYNDRCELDANTTINGDVTGAIVVTADGVVQQNEPSTTYGLYVAISWRMSWKAAGVSTTRVPHMRQTTAFLAEIGLVSNYDTNNDFGWEVTQAQAELASAGWNDTLALRGIRANFGGTGGDVTIGQLPRSSVAALFEWHKDVVQVIMDQARAFGTVPWHQYSAANGRYVNPIDFPEQRTSYHNSNFITSSRGSAFSGPVNYDAAHCPSFSRLPFMLTGSPLLLSQMQGQATGLIMFFREIQEREAYTNNAYTSGGRTARIAETKAAGKGVTVFSAPRACAWIMGALTDAAYWTPRDAQSIPGLMTLLASGACRGYEVAYDSRRAAHGIAYSIQSLEDRTGEISPWMEFMFTESLARASRLGITRALVVARQKADFAVGGHINSANGFRGEMMPHYRLNTRLNGGEPGADVQTWAELQTAAVAFGRVDHGENYANVASIDGDYNARSYKAVVDLYNLFSTAGFSADANKAALAFNFLESRTKAKSFLTATLLQDQNLLWSYNVVPWGLARSGTVAMSLPATPLAPLAVPANTALPTITAADGTDLGDVLGGNDGTWSNGPILSYAYQWQRNSGTAGAYVDIAGATGATRIRAAGDAGFNLRRGVKATNADGPAAAFAYSAALTIPAGAGTPKAATLVSTFDTNGGLFALTGGATISGGLATVPPNGRVESVLAYDAVDSAFVVRVGDRASGDISHQIVVIDPTDAEKYIYLNIIGFVITAGVSAGGSAAEAWSQATHRYLRFSVSGTTWTVARSADNVTYSTISTFGPSAGTPAVAGSKLQLNTLGDSAGSMTFDSVG